MADMAQSQPPAREKLLRAAISLIGRDGPARLTHRSVAAAAHLSPGTATYHFATLDDLIEQAFLLYIGEYRAAMDSALALRPLESLEDVAAFLATLTMLDADNADLARFEYEMILHAHRREHLGAAVDRWVTSLESRISAALRQLGRSDPDQLANVAINMCRGIEIEVLSKQKKVNAADFQARLLRVLRSG